MDLQQEFKEALLYALKNGHTPDFMKGIEQLFRNETSHFKSSNFAVTRSAGMEVAKTSSGFVPSLPYGWTSLEQWWEDNKDYCPSSTYDQIDNGSELSASRGMRRFIVFPTMIASVMTVCKVIENKGRFGAWFNHNEADEIAYEQTLNSITPRLMNEILEQNA